MTDPFLQSPDRRYVPSAVTVRVVPLALSPSPVTAMPLWVKVAVPVTVS